MSCSYLCSGILQNHYGEGRFQSGRRYTKLFVNSGIFGQMGLQANFHDFCVLIFFLNEALVLRKRYSMYFFLKESLVLISAAKFPRLFCQTEPPGLSFSLRSRLYISEFCYLEIALRKGNQCPQVAGAIVKPKYRVKAPSSVFRLLLAALPPFTNQAIRIGLQSVSGLTLPYCQE